MNPKSNDPKSFLNGYFWPKVSYKLRNFSQFWESKSHLRNFLVSYKKWVNRNFVFVFCNISHMVRVRLRSQKVNNTPHIWGRGTSSSGYFNYRILLRLTLFAVSPYTFGPLIIYRQAPSSGYDSASPQGLVVTIVLKAKILHQSYWDDSLFVLKA